MVHGTVMEWWKLAVRAAYDFAVTDRVLVTGHREPIT